MKKSQANRGRNWETRLDRVHARYRKKGLAYIERLHPPFLLRKRTGKGSFEGILLGRGAPDYLVCTNGWTLLIDAKSTNSKRFPYAKVPEHQAKAFDSIRERGGSRMGGLLLINFAKQNVAVAVDWRDIRTTYNHWVRNRKMDLKSPPGVASLSFESAKELGMWTGSSDVGDLNYLPAVILALGARELEEEE